jgi:23S rRNA (pseudouridine1915-N3)-methyltransferase
MQIAIISVSSKQPAWVQAGFTHYAKRVRGSCRLELKEIPLARRGANRPLARQIEAEGELMLAAAPKGAHIVALDEGGRRLSTRSLADRMQAWMAIGRSPALLIGGPDGLSPRCLEQAAESWSISSLTLPHGLVRIVVAEALYRAWSLLEGHPYHRA